MNFQKHMNIEHFMTFEISTYLLWQCGNRSSSRVSSTNSPTISSRKMNDVLRINCYGLCCSKFDFTIDGACNDSHDSMLFFLQSPKTVWDDGEWSSMQKEFSILIKNWWWILELKFWCSWWNWENWNGFRSNLGMNQFLLCLASD